MAFIFKNKDKRRDILSIIAQRFGVWGRERRANTSSILHGLGILESVKSPVGKVRSNLLTMTGLPRGSEMGIKKGVKISSTSV